MSRRHDVQSGDGVVAAYQPDGKIFVVGHGAPTNSQIGFAKGCLYLDLTNALVYYNSGTSASSTWTLLSAAGIGTAVSGVAAGYKLARGETALDGSNPTPVTTGLATIVAATVSLKGTAAPGVGTSIVTYDTSAGTLNLYGWKVTSSSDTTLIASTGTETVGWVAVGT